MKKKILIEGMHCASCASNIEKSLKKVPGISEVNISLMTRKGFVVCDEKVKDEDIKKAINRAGYNAISVENE